MQKNGNSMRNWIPWLLANALFIGAAVGLIWANVHHESYDEFKHALHFAVNDIAMVAFFALAGKEIREAMLPGVPGRLEPGPLSSLRTAALPLIATLGGMAMPAAIYAAGAFIFDATLTPGWAIPTATDIAFSAIVTRKIFGVKHPAVVFLLLLAIADDAGGLIVLATAYPQGATNPELLLLCASGAIVLAFFMRRVGVRNFWAYLPAVALSWVGFFKGGIHPALAAVPLMWALPHRAYDLGLFSEEELVHSKREDTLTHMEHQLKRPVEVILGLFGFVNAGVVFSAVGTGTVLVLAGLIVGKPLGIYLFTKLGQKLFGLELPRRMNDRDLVVMGCAAGIGFTVALFVATVAFPAGAIQDSVKMGALLSVTAAAATFLVARVLRVHPQRNLIVVPDVQEAE